MRADGTILARLRGAFRPWLGWTLTERRLVAGILLFAALALAGMSLKTASPDRTAFLLVDVSASVNEEETVRLAKEVLARNKKKK